MADHKSTIVLPVIVSVVLAGGLGFWGGDLYAQHAATAARAARAGGFASGTFGGRGGTNGTASGGIGAVRGTVESISGSTMTVKLANGSSRIVVLSGSTTVSKGETGSASDIQTGNTVQVVGTQNSDQSVTAQSIQLNPPAAPARPAGN